MAYANYPHAKLPYPVRDNYSLKYQQKMGRIGMDDGQGRNRRQFNTQPMSHALTWRMTWDQYAFFEAFLKYDCADCTSWFWMMLAPGASLQLIRLVKYPAATFNTDKGMWDLTAEAEVMRAAPTGGLFDQTGGRVLLDMTGDYSAGSSEYKLVTNSELPSWPPFLPWPEKKDFQAVREGQPARSNIDGGKASMRARFDQKATTYQFKLELTADQLDSFNRFVHDTLYGGLAWFNAPFANGLGPTKVRACFTELPTIVPDGAIYVASCTLMTAAAPLMTLYDYLGGNIPANETVVFSDRVSISLTLSPLSETVTFSDAVKITLITNLVETVTFSDTLSVVYSGKVGFSELVSFSDAVRVALTLGTLNDNVTFTSSGRCDYNDYCDGDYCTDDYVGTSLNFS